MDLDSLLRHGNVMSDGHFSIGETTIGETDNGEIDNGSGDGELTQG